MRPIGGARNIRVGKGSVINTGVRFGVPNAPISIGRSVHIGPRVMFETVNHGLHFVPGKGRGTVTAPIVLEDEVWIGAGSILLSGVTVGRGSVVAAGAVVTKDVPPSSLCAGVPARVMRPITPADVLEPCAAPVPGAHAPG